MSAGETLEKRKIDASQHFTEPPPRYSEASLVKRMEELGIGRPSTYASILQVLKDRGYVRIDKKRLVPEDKGRVLTAFLESFFARYVEYDFTAGLEEQLDRISNNEIAWRELLRDFWRDFTAAVGDIKDLRIAQVHRRARRDARAAPVSAARGRHRSAQVPELRHRPALAQARQVRRLHRLLELSRMPLHPPVRGRQRRERRRRHEEARRGSGDRARSHAALPAASAPMCSSASRPRTRRQEKPKRAGTAEGLSPDDVDLDRALGLLSLPREVGKHPEDGEPIMAGIGRFGPYVQHGKTYANLDAGDDVLTIGLNRAVTLIAEKKAKVPARAAASAPIPAARSATIPTRAAPIVVKNGRYGPYVSHDGVNATLPSDIDAGDDHARRGGRADRRARRPWHRQEAAKKAPRARAAAAAKPAAQGVRRKPRRAAPRARRPSRSGRQAGAEAAARRSPPARPRPAKPADR